MKSSGSKAGARRIATRADSRSPEVSVTAAPRGLKQAMIDAARAALLARRYHRGRLHVAVIGAAEMRRQHARWMDDDTPTDVLTFDLRDEPERGLVDGELLVCSTVARERARGYGGDWRAELLLYVVHGCMHLCGLDDHDPVEAARMHRLEDRVLKQLGWGEVYAAERRAERSRVGLTRRAEGRKKSTPPSNRKNRKKK